MPPAPRVVTILERLARQPTAPFHEHAVVREATAVAKEAGVTARPDTDGNLIVTPPGRRRGTPVWLVAHMDHPGFEVVRRGEAAFLGGIAPAYRKRGVALRFYSDGEAIPVRTGKVTSSDRRWRAQLVGPEARRLRRGDFGVWEVPDFRRRGDRVHARQLDDLAGCAVSLAVLERAVRRRSLHVRALLTRAEEAGFIGSIAAIRGRRIPKRSWIVNVEASRALPGASIGGGPVIRVGDRARTFDPEAENLLAAARARLPKGTRVQRALMSGGTCEATAWGVYGYRTTGVAIPLGNYHNQGPGDRVRAEVVSSGDLETAVDLIELAVRQVGRPGGRDADFRRRLDRLWRERGRRLES